jgi:hypothetical protein
MYAKVHVKEQHKVTPLARTAGSGGETSTLIMIVKLELGESKLLFHL